MAAEKKTNEKLGPEIIEADPAVVKANEKFAKSTEKTEPDKSGPDIFEARTTK